MLCPGKFGRLRIPPELARVACRMYSNVEETRIDTTVTGLSRIPIVCVCVCVCVCVLVHTRVC